MGESSTQRRINAQAREALAAILLFDISDPRLQSVTVTGCKVSPDRGHCTVYYEAPAGTYDACAAAFARASSAIRACLSQRLQWRITPELQFILDDTVDDALRISAALAKEGRALSELTDGEGVKVEADVYEGLDEGGR